MPRRLLLTIFASCLLCLAATPVHAAVGVVVRLVSSGGALDGAVTATVKNADGAEVLLSAGIVVLPTSFGQGDQSCFFDLCGVGVLVRQVSHTLEGSFSALSKPTCKFTLNRS